MPVLNKETYFISYTNRDEYDIKWALWLEWFLRVKLDRETIIQEYDFKYGGSFKTDMHNALKKADVVMCIMTGEYLKSEFCTEEWINAKRFIPLKADDCEPDGLLKTRTYIDLYKLNKEDAIKEITKAINGIKRPADEPPFPIRSKAAKEKILSANDLAEPEFPAHYKAAVLSAVSLPKHNLPDPNPFFAGREGKLKEFYKYLSAGFRVAVTGAGGFGKTQMSVKYAYDHEKEYDCIRLFNAESETKLREDYYELAVSAGLSVTRETGFNTILSLIMEWTANREKCLFIYDNAEGQGNDRANDRNEWNKKLCGYLPSTTAKNIHIIVNTRDEEANQYIRGKKIRADVFPEPDAVEYIQKRLEDSGGAEGKDALDLAEMLGYLPLALAQATAYISLHGDYNVPRYIKLLRKHGVKALGADATEADYKETVFTAWKISFDRIKLEAAKQLFNVCAYFAPDDMPLGMLTDGREQLPQPLRGILEPERELELEEILRELTRYSLIDIRREENDAFLSIHRIIQSAVKQSLDNDRQWAGYALSVAYNVFEYKYGNIPLMNAFAVRLPHAAEAAENARRLFTDDETQAKASQIYFEAGLGLNNQGQYAKAIDWYQKALTIREKVLGGEHPDTASTCNNIAVIYRKQGDYEKALDWYQKALRIREKVFGKEHPNTAETYNNIAIVYNNQGDYEKALDWHQKSLIIKEKVLGKEHPSTAIAYNNIAFIYSRQGAYGKALVWHQKALTIREKVLGGEHPSIAHSYNNIGEIYNNEGDYEKALDWYQKALTIREKVFGGEHLNTATTYHNMGVTYQNLGDCEKALDLYQKALTVRKKVLGTGHPDTKQTLRNIQDLLDLSVEPPLPDGAR